MNKIARVILDCANGHIPTQFSQMDKETRENAVRAEILNVMGLEKFEKVAMRKAMRRPEVKVAMYEIIEEVVAGNFKTDSDVLGRFAELFCEVKNLAYGDQNLFYLEGKGALTVSEYSGSHLTVRRQRFQSGQSFSLEMRNFIISTYVYLEQLLANRLDLAKFVMALNEAVEKKIKSMVVTAFTAGLTSLPTSYKVTGTYSEDNILLMLEKLEAVNGAKPRLIGTPAGIRALQGTVDIKYSDNMKDQRNEDFVLSVWNSYECITVPNTIQDGTIDTLVLNPKRIYAVCGDEKICKVVFEGDAIVKDGSSDELANADLSIDYVLAFKANACVAYSGLVGTIDLP